MRLPGPAVRPAVVSGEMAIEAGAIRGTYEELLDAAEDLKQILSAAASDLLDLTPGVEVWLVDLLERLELALGATRGVTPGL